MLETQVLFNLFIPLILWGRENEQNPGFVHFCSFLGNLWRSYKTSLKGSPKMNKMNKTRVFIFYIEPKINRMNNMNKTRASSNCFNYIFCRGKFSPKNPQHEQMNRTRVLFIFAFPIRSTKWTKGFEYFFNLFYFCRGKSPHPGMDKMNKTRICSCLLTK